MGRLRVGQIYREMRILVVIVENRSSQTRTVVAEYRVHIYRRSFDACDIIVILSRSGSACFSYDRYTRPSPVFIIFDCIQALYFSIIFFVRYNFVLYTHTLRTATTSFGRVIKTMPSDNKSNSKPTSGSKPENKSTTKTPIADNKNSSKPTTPVNKTNSKTTSADKYVL